MSTDTCARPTSSTLRAPSTDADATRVLRHAEALLRRWDTPLEATILSVVDRHFTRDIATMAVSFRHDGVARLEANPDFVVDIGIEGTAFVLCHEAMHLLLNHLRVEDGDDRAWLLAAETVINHWVGEHTGRPLPVSTATGEPVGVEPRGVWDLYRQAVSQPVTYDAFVETDRDCAAHLRLMLEALPPVACDHQPEAEEDVTGNAGAVESVLAVAVQRAADGDDRLKGQLLRLADATPNAPLWTQVGISDLRTTSSRLGATGFWRMHLRGVIARRLRRKLTVAYDRKVGWWDPSVFADLGVDVDPDVGMPLTLRPDRSRRKHAAIYLDTSGSIPDAVVDAVASMVGEISGTDVDWHTFDHDVHAFTPGDQLLGGGGTDFAVIVDDLLEEPDFPDAVLVLTDGYAPPIDPPHPERWIWLIVADGDGWPLRLGMQTVNVPNLEGASR